MVNPSPIGSNVLLSIDKALIDEITTDSGFKLYLAPEYNFELNTTVTGKISFLPKHYSGILSIGDEVAFSYQVISNRSFPNTSDYFVAVIDKGSVRVWQNGKGEKLRMVQHQGIVAPFWIGTFFDKQGQFIPEKSTRGTEEQVERWMHNNFKFGNCENFIFRNKVIFNNNEYWKCSLENIFAKKENEKILTTSDRVICKYIDVPIEQRVLKQNKIHLPDSSVQLRFYDRAIIESGGEKLGLKKGDIVSFDDRHCEKYQLWGKQFFLIRERLITGVWQQEQ